MLTACLLSWSISFTATAKALQDGAAILLLVWLLRNLHKRSPTRGGDNGPPELVLGPDEAQLVPGELLQERQHVINGPPGVGAVIAIIVEASQALGLSYGQLVTSSSLTPH